MTAMDAAVGVAALAALAAAGVEAHALRRRRPPGLAALAWTGLAAALAAAAFLFLLSRFAAADLRYENVFLYTRSDLALRWRLAGAWTGQEGSLLLWGAGLAAVAAVLAWRHRRLAGDAAGEAARGWTRLFLLAIVAAFLGAAWRQGTFDATPAFFLEGRPLGNGLNPTLRSPFMLIHPPLMFAAYSLAAVPAAAALGHLASGTDRWSWVAFTWSRVGWLVYTVAMGLGGLWAYYTLGFGGYWAWDPVEVANLLPWLALTLFLHAQLHHRRHGLYRSLGPFLGVLPFWLTVFSTVSTRSGLWVSVHAFTDPTNRFDPDAAARFLGILEAEPALPFYTGFLLALATLALAIGTLRLAAGTGTLRRTARVSATLLAAFAAYAAVAPVSALSILLEGASRATGGRTGLGLLAIAFAATLLAAAPALAAPEGAARRPRRLDLRSLAAYAVAVLGLSLLVLFLFHVAAANGWSRAFYESRIPWLAAPAALGLLVLEGHGVHGRRRSLAIAAGALAAAVAAALLVPAHRGGAFLAVLAAVLVLVAFDRVRRAGAAPGTGKGLLRAHSLLLAAALLDVAFWLNPPSRIGVGALSLHVAWPVQLPMGAAALYALWQAHRLIAGHPVRRPGHVHLLVGLLGGYFAAPPMAAAAWLMARRHPRAEASPARTRALLRQAALYGVHLAVGVALLGYAASTYFQDAATATLRPGDALDVGGTSLAFAGAPLAPEPGTPFAAAVEPTLAGPRGEVTGRFAWEAQVGAHFPRPATLRTWEGDLYLQVDAVTLAADGPCLESGREVAAYQASGRICMEDRVESVTLTLTSLPALALVWAALALFAFHMTLLVASDRPAPRHAGVEGEGDG